MRSGEAAFCLRQLLNRSDPDDRGIKAGDPISGGLVLPDVRQRKTLIWKGFCDKISVC